MPLTVCDQNRLNKFFCFTIPGQRSKLIGNHFESARDAEEVDLEDRGSAEEGADHQRKRSTVRRVEPRTCSSSGSWDGRGVERVSEDHQKPVKSNQGRFLHTRLIICCACSRRSSMFITWPRSRDHVIMFITWPRSRDHVIMYITWPWSRDHVIMFITWPRSRDHVIMFIHVTTVARSRDYVYHVTAVARSRDHVDHVTTITWLVTTITWPSDLVSWEQYTEYWQYIGRLPNKLILKQIHSNFKAHWASSIKYIYHSR